jgi:SAM-dependent methyltransferase
MPTLPPHEPREQFAIADWFDTTYATKGERYLRPAAAYPIYLQLLAAQAGERLLDIACGVGHLLHAAQRRGVRGVGIDLSSTALRLARPRVGGAALLLGNAQTLPFGDHSFDLVTCIGAIERLLDRPAALREFRRVASPSARFCFMVRNSHTLSWTLWQRWLGRQNHRGHQDALPLAAWRELFLAAGFAIDAVHPDQWLRQRLRRLLRGLRRWPATQDEPIARGVLPLRYANEFIFLLRHGAN